MAKVTTGFGRTWRSSVPTATPLTTFRFSGFKYWGIHLSGGLGITEREALVKYWGTTLVTLGKRTQCKRSRLQAQYGPNLLRADIRKDRPGRFGSSRTYTLRYTIRDHVPL
jgi:hypothetical protein